MNFRKYGHTIGFVLAVFVFGVVIYTANYVNDKKVYDNSISGCERCKLDRQDNAEGWEAARQARLDSATLNPDREAATVDYEAAKKYEKIINSLNSRIKPCKQLNKEQPKWILWTP